MKFVSPNLPAPTPAQKWILNSTYRNLGCYTYSDHVFMRYWPLSDSIFGELIRLPFNNENN